MWRSLQTRVLTLPDDLVVYPTHGGGSFCAADTEGERITTIGRERAGNPLLQAPDEDAFVALLLETFGSYPTYFARLRAVNQRGPRVIGRFPALAKLDLEAFDRHIDADADLVDVRPIEAFAEGHIPGSLSIAFRPSFASWLGWLVEPDRPLLFVVEPEQDRLDLVRQALGIGYEQLAGELAGGIETWRDAGRTLATTELTSTPLEIEATRVIDVRQASEYEDGHVPGALHLELGSLPDAADAAAGPTTMICAHGERAMTAASVAERQGHRPQVFLGGAERWARSVGRPLVRS
jgi:rhodanese-related sulfurtransferase